MARSAASARQTLLTSWTVQYEANELPENATPAWSVEHAPNPLVNAIVEVNPAGILHISGLASDVEKVDWLILPDWNDTTGITLEFRMKVVSGDTIVGDSGDTALFIDSGTTGADIQIYTDGVSFSDGLGYVDYSFDTTDDYHIYRITLKNGVSELYVDSVLRATTNSYGGGGASLDFQAAQGNVDAESLWDYIYYRTDGAFAPGGRNPASGRTAASGRNSI